MIFVHINFWIISAQHDFLCSAYLCINYFLTSAYFSPQEYEDKIVPWLWSFGVFIGFRFLAFLFFAIVNDLIFFYNITTVMLWIVMLTVSIYGWLVVYSLYLELSQLTKLEDLAHLRVRLDVLHNSVNMSSLNISKFFLDGNDAVAQRFSRTISGWLTTDDATFHRVDDARVIDTLESLVLFCIKNLNCIAYSVTFYRIPVEKVHAELYNFLFLDI